MKNDYHDQAMRALQLAGMSERTQESYTRFVRQLVEFCGKTPEKITEQELQDYFLHRKNKDKWAAATLRISYSGIKFFFINVLRRDWHTLKLINAKRGKALPTVLSIKEAWAILDAVKTPQNKAYLTVVYTCGLRLSEGLHLQVPDIDSDRMRIHVHGKGAKGRYVPLPEATLKVLRDYWKTHRNPTWTRIYDPRCEAQACKGLLRSKLERAVWETQSSKHQLRKEFLKYGIIQLELSFLSVKKVFRAVKYQFKFDKHLVPIRRIN